MLILRAALSLASILVSVSADTCNPVKSLSCSPDPALGGSFTEDFSNGLGSHFNNLGNQGNVTTGDDGLSLTINKRYDNPSVHSNFYLMFGYVEVELKAAEGKGIVSSFFLQSDDLDEIDIELFGGDQYQWQSNYFVQGNTSTYDRGGYHSINPSPLEDYHKYAINWTKDSLDWIVDGTVIRSLQITNSQGYPQTPMRIYAGIWAGGDPSNEEGTIEWAGGTTDYSSAPFTMHIKSLSAVDYSTGSEYSYSDQSGFWETIKAEDGEVNGRFNEAQDDVSKITNGETIEDTGSSGSSSSSSDSSSTSSSEASSSSESASSTSASSSSESSSSSSSSSGSSSSSSESKSSEAPTSHSLDSTATTEGAGNNNEESSSSSASVTTRTASSEKSSSSSSSETAKVSASSEGSGAGLTPSRSMMHVIVFLVLFMSFGFALV